MGEFSIETDRLILRDWRASDATPFHDMSNDPRVMQFLGVLKTVAEVDDIIERMSELQERVGCCFWAIEQKKDAAFLGFCGVKPGPAETPIEGRVEIGWRLAHPYWGLGFAREAAEASLDWCFSNRGDDSVWAITVDQNVRSRTLMERLGMQQQHALGFDHPDVAYDSPLRPHVTYSIGRDQWRA